MYDNFPYYKACLVIIVALCGPGILQLLQKWLKCTSLTTNEAFEAKHFRKDDNVLNVTKEPDLPEGWWKSEQILGLERRAIFSKVINVLLRIACC